MSEDEFSSQGRPERGAAEARTRPSERSGNARMGARTWMIAYLYGAPADYGIVPLPEWTVRRTEERGLSFAEDDESEPFISAQHPMRVRR